MNVSCFVCGCCLPDDPVAYFSDRRTDSGPVAGVDGSVWGDVALVLCGPCVTKGEAMPDAEAYAFYASGRRWTEEKKSPGRGRAISDLSAGIFGYHAGYAAARSGPPELGSIEWVTEKLSGREFPVANGARDFLRQAFEAERTARAAREAWERAKWKRHARYEVTFILELDDDDGSSETDVEGVVENILDEAMRSPDGADYVVRDGLRLYDVTNVSARFDEMVMS